MIVTFCGHGDFRETEEERRKMFGVLEKIAKQGKVDFYLGGYGNFDGFAYECCKRFKRVNPNVVGVGCAVFHGKISEELFERIEKILR